jgi:hypothetical protein
MESSKEQIEAQLCAYIDGELSDAERAEIERHLASNPQHKSLIAELRRHSGLLQDLPRASAPLELNEALCGQLERSALLNASDEEGGGAILSINRWPQITAVAAVLMLAIGLGIVVYYVLPPSGAGTRGQVAMNEHKGHFPATNGVATARDRLNAKQLGKPEDPESRSAGTHKKAMSDSFASSTQPQFDPAVARAGEIKDGRLITAKEVEALRQRTNFRLHGDNDAFNLGNSSLCLVVSTNNAVAANNQVAAFFDKNSIHYLKYDDSAGLAESESALGSKVAANPAYGLNAATDDRVKDADKSKPAEAPGSAAGSFNNGNARGGNGGSLGLGDSVRGGLQKPENQNAAYGREDAKGPDRKADSKITEEAGRGIASGVTPPATAPAGNGALPAKPGVVAEAGKFPANSEATAKLEQNADGTKFGSVDGAAKDNGLRLSQTNDPSGLGGRSAQAPLPAEKAGAADALSWEFKDRVARARFAERLADSPEQRNGVIIARMNRRQANELQAALSREQGQQAELTTVNLSDAAHGSRTEASMGLAGDKNQSLNAPASSVLNLSKSTALESNDKTLPPVTREARTLDSARTPAVLSAKIPAPEAPANLEGKQNPVAAVSGRGYEVPTTHPSDAMAKRGMAERDIHQKDEGLALEQNKAPKLQTDPLDEPVDVFIVVKGDAAAPIQLDVPKAKAESAPESEKK